MKNLLLILALFVGNIFSTDYLECRRDWGWFSSNNVIILIELEYAPNLLYLRYTRTDAIKDESWDTKVGHDAEYERVRATDDIYYYRKYDQRRGGQEKFKIERKSLILNYGIKYQCKKLENYDEFSERVQWRRNYINNFNKIKKEKNPNKI